MANQEHVAILELRGPRTVGCILVGAAFAVAGAIMQGVTRNPLADSGLLGINAGAAFALALCLALLPGMSFAGVVGCSFVGAAFALAVVFGAVSFRRRNVDRCCWCYSRAARWGSSSRRSLGVAIFFNIGYSLTFWMPGACGGIRADTLAADGAVHRGGAGALLGAGAARDGALAGQGGRLGARRERGGLAHAVCSWCSRSGGAAVAWPTSGLRGPRCRTWCAVSWDRTAGRHSRLHEWAGRCSCFWPMCSPARSWRRAKFPSASSSPSSACRSSSGARGGGERP